MLLFSCVVSFRNDSNGDGRRLRRYIHTLHAEVSGGTLLRGPDEAVEIAGEAGVAETEISEKVDQLCRRQSAGDSTGPELDVGANLGRELFLNDDVGDLQPPAWAEYSPDFAERLLLVGRQIEDAV